LHGAFKDVNFHYVWAKPVYRFLSCMGGQLFEFASHVGLMQAPKFAGHK